MYCARRFISMIVHGYPPEAIIAFMMNRPRGYFGVGRDQMSLDGISPPPGLAPGVPGVSLSRMQVGDKSLRSAIAQFNAERIAVQTWPMAENRIVQAEFHE